MSATIVLGIQMECDFFSEQATKLLFSIVTKGCNNKMAMEVLESDVIRHKNNQCFIALYDSYNYKMGEPLIGKDGDYEVVRHGNRRLYNRLKSISKLLRYISKLKKVTSLDIYITTNYDFDDLLELSLNRHTFCRTMESYINEPLRTENCFLIHWII